LKSLDTWFALLRTCHCWRSEGQGSQVRESRIVDAGLLRSYQRSASSSVIGCEDSSWTPPFLGLNKSLSSFDSQSSRSLAYRMFQMTFRSILRSYDTGVRDIALVFDVPHRYGRENLLRTTIPRFCINKRIVDRGYSLIFVVK
jgi:hypothetical protein